MAWMDVVARAIKASPRAQQAVVRAAPRLNEVFSAMQTNARVLDSMQAALINQAVRTVQGVAAARQRLGGNAGLLEAVVVGDIAPLQQVRQLRRQVEGALELARADAELSEAFAVFQAHEHHYTAWRAQAVLMMKLLEREAVAFVVQLPPERRAQLEEAARQIRDASLTTGTLTQGDSQCGQCERKLNPQLRGGDCCSAMVYLGWDNVDGLFRVLLGERAPVIRFFQGDNTRCGFVGATGCVLTPGARPTVCTAYYCGPYKEDLQQQGRWEALSQALLELNNGRKTMAFRQKMAQRFSLKIDTTRDKDHPLDFIWDRLRSSGAELGATGKRQDQPSHPRLNVVS